MLISTKEFTEKAKSLADHRLSIYRDYFKLEYNTFDKQMRGALAEYAFSYILTKYKIAHNRMFKQVIPSKIDHGDIYLHKKRFYIEIKSNTKPTHKSNFISYKLFEKLKKNKKGFIIVIMRVSTDQKQVRFSGWNYLYDFTEIPTYHRNGKTYFKYFPGMRKAEDLITLIKK